ncbi:MAG: hypothetical protein AAGG81_04120 [Chlamydiota bacterium]
MSQRAQTKDQRFLLALYERAMQQGDVATPFSRYEIGESIGLHKKAINTICRDLLQCNFLKKEGPDDVYLTKNGEALVLSILESQ